MFSGAPNASGSRNCEFPSVPSAEPLLGASETIALGKNRRRSDREMYRTNNVLIYFHIAKNLPADQMIILYDEERSPRRKIGCGIDESAKYSGLCRPCFDLVYRVSKF
jgi:hypothetical protein